MILPKKRLIYNYLQKRNLYNNYLQKKKESKINVMIIYKRIRN